MSVQATSPSSRQYLNTISSLPESIRKSDSAMKNLLKAKRLMEEMLITYRSVSQKDLKTLSKREGVNIQMLRQYIAAAHIAIQDIGTNLSRKRRLNIEEG